MGFVLQKGFSGGKLAQAQSGAEGARARHAAEKFRFEMKYFLK